MESSGIAMQENSLWPRHMVKFFIDIMIEEVTKGNMNNGVFSPKVWKIMLEKLNGKSGRFFNLKQIKQKFNRLRAKHREFSLLLQYTGFGWDIETNTVSAHEEVWKSYILAHPMAAQYKKQGLEHYELLSIIFNSSIATDILPHASIQDPPNYADELEFENEYLNRGVHVDLEGDDDVALQTIERVTRSGTRSGKRTTEFVEKNKKKECRTNQMGEALQAWAEATKARAKVQLAEVERLRERSMEASSARDTSSDYSIAKCVYVLNQIDDISDDVYVKAMEKFTDYIWRELFITIPLERKKAWLDRLL